MRTPAVAGGTPPPGHPPAHCPPPDSQTSLLKHARVPQGRSAMTSSTTWIRVWHQAGVPVRPGSLAALMVGPRHWVGMLPGAGRARQSYSTENLRRRCPSVRGHVAWDVKRPGVVPVRWAGAGAAVTAGHVGGRRRSGSGCTCVLGPCLVLWMGARPRRQEGSWKLNNKAIDLERRPSEPSACIRLAHPGKRESGCLGGVVPRQAVFRCMHIYVCVWPAPLRLIPHLFPQHAYTATPRHEPRPSQNSPFATGGLDLLERPRAGALADSKMRLSRATMAALAVLAVLAVVATTAHAAPKRKGSPSGGDTTITHKVGGQRPVAGLRRPTASSATRPVMLYTCSAAHDSEGNPLPSPRCCRPGLL